MIEIKIETPRDTIEYRRIHDSRGNFFVMWPLDRHGNFEEYRPRDDSGARTDTADYLEAVESIYGGGA